MRNKGFKSFLLTVMAAILLLCPSVVRAQSLSASQQRRDALEKDIKILREQLGKTSSDHESALAKIAIIQAQIDSRKKLLKESDAVIARYNTQIKNLGAELARQERALDTLQIHYTALVQSAYKNRDVKVWYMYLLSSEDLPQAYRRLAYFKSLSAQIRKQSERIRALQQEIGEQRAEVQKLRTQAQAVRRQRSADLSQLSNEQTQQKTLIKHLESNKKAYKAALLSKQKEQAALNKQIAKMLQEASGESSNKSSKSSKTKPAKPVDEKLSKNFEQNKGKLPWPVSGPVVDHFGTSKKGSITLRHDYISIACERASVAKSVFDGTVVNVGLLPGFGHCVMIQHGAYYTIYGKLQAVYVHHGDKVTTGQPIGEVGVFSGRSTLNFYVVQRMTYLNPETWLRAR